MDEYRQRSGIIGKNIVVYSDRVEGEPQIINSGKVLSIGENLELYLKNQIKPIVRGRIIITQ